MLPGMTYTWRVRTATESKALALNAPGWSKWVAGSFSTRLPVSWSISPDYPAVGETIATVTPTLRWRNQFSWIFYYEIQIAKDPSFNTDPATAIGPVYWELLHGGESVPFNSYAVRAEAALEPNATYYWRVRPRVQGAGAPVEWSETWYFLTQ